MEGLCMLWGVIYEWCLYVVGRDACMISPHPPGDMAQWHCARWYVYVVGLNVHVVKQVLVHEPVVALQQD